MNIKIMIVEDDQILANQIQDFLKRWEYEVLLVTEFQHIQKQVEKDQPQLVLMDINLPFLMASIGVGKSENILMFRLFILAAAMTIEIKLWELHRAVMIVWKSRFNWIC